ncbi:DUF3604 domain-containing protein [Paenibacillus allorhizosphaerae]|uniref:DUF3604 domain-containing protein n=1 Tax=Paenibacillus allorhizosphaerae TaxID=2849866 RepID=A0ABN7TLH6_9BACL|nr:DUF3604 domain-containing protein [Paenibacillus allorhizosphaerae]CAG7636349.1 hypothetical protein PAECIP111802_02245 [Paenibacillus allorhizosphaerae]
MPLYWGDLHNHCGISYGFGGLENALQAAKGQLDFCAIIGHASWYDIPARTEGLEYLVDFHKEGFAKLRNHWDYVLETVKSFNVPGEFVTFQGYEAHSSKYGDHHFLSPDDDFPLVEGESPAAIVEKLAPRRVIAVPHHVGYTPGYRGGNWDRFSAAISPIVEVYSKHGSGMSDQSPFPYYHDMGPRDSRSSVYAALARKLRFGFVGSTDHHAGYPGSYGDGRLAVLADAKTRESIWEAILARRTYAVTGDKIECKFTMNGLPMGSETTASQRRFELNVTACDQIDKIVVYKNLRPWKVVNGELLAGQSSGVSQTAGKYKVKVELGWGNNKAGFEWDAIAEVRGGKLAAVETCFRGRSILAPTPELRDDPTMNALGNRIVSQSDQAVAWSCMSFKNPTTLHPHTAAVILEVEGDVGTELHIKANGAEIKTTVGELLGGNRTVHLQPYNSEAIMVHRAIPQQAYTVSEVWTDTLAESECDVYHAEIKQVNGQCAWISPIYVLA